MKVSLFSSVLNLGLLLGVFLRRKGHDVRVFINEDLTVNNKPEWECIDSRELASLATVTVNVDVKRLLFGCKAERRFRHELAKADVVQTFGEDVIWSSGCGAPDTVLSICDDLDVLPYRRDSLKIRVYSALLRRAQRKCRALCYTIPQQHWICQKRGLKNAKFLPYAIPIDCERLSPLSIRERSIVRDHFGIPREAFLIFQPSRQEWSNLECPDANHKGNDRFLRAFARLLRGPGKNAWLLAVEKGRDVGKSRALLHELGVEERVRWISQQNKSGLRQCIGASDLVADQFTYGFYGISCLESMSIGRPVLIYLHSEYFDKLGIEIPPVISVCSEQEIYEALCNLIDNRARGDDIGALSREWIIRYHGWEPVVDRYLALYRELI